MATARRTLIATERTLDEQYAEGEVELLAVRRHVFVLLKPVGRAMVPTILAMWYTLEIPTANHVTGFLWLVSILMWVWVAWCEAERRRNVFVITTKRVLLYEGIFTRNVPMMKLSKVTDLTYTRTVPGRIFRYGTIVIESAGQDQAMHDIHYLPEPDTVYAELNGALFGEKARRRSLEGIDILGHKHKRATRARRRPDDGPPDPSDGSGAPDGPGPGSSGGSGGTGGGHSEPPHEPGGPTARPQSPIHDYGSSSDDDGPFLRGTAPMSRAGHGTVRAEQDRSRRRDTFDPSEDPTDVPPAGYRPRWRPVTDEDEDEDTIYRSPDRRPSTTRDDDTGPIPIEERRPRFT